MDAPNSSSLLGKNIKLTISALTNNNLKEFKVVMAGDVNGDGSFNALDIVKAKKISAGTATGTAENYASAGTSIADGISAINLANLRNKILDQ